MNNRALGTMSDVGPLVLLTNEIVRQWPTGCSLDLVHAPFAAANVPATTDRAFYAPLATMKPDTVRFAAGFAHEAQPLAHQRQIRTIIDDLLDRQVEIAAACGLGRRTAEDGRALAGTYRGAVYRLRTSWSIAGPELRLSRAPPIPCLPTGGVPVSSVGDGALGSEEMLVVPHHQMRHARQEYLVATGTSIGLVRPANRADLPD